MKNLGFAVHNPSLYKPESQCVVVLGRPRGGTTMTTSLVQAAGFFMGSNLTVTIEDPNFMDILKNEKPNGKAFMDLVDLRMKSYLKWGFKFPFSHNLHLLENISNIRYVVVFRDSFATSYRNHISVGVHYIDGLRINNNVERRILDFIIATKNPVFLFSYEKALLHPKDICQALAEFLGVQIDERTIGSMLEKISPSDPAYLEKTKPYISFHIDRIGPERISGWALNKQAFNIPIEVKISVDGIVTLSALANVFRPDLKKAFGTTGNHGFSFDVSTLKTKSGILKITACTCSFEQILFENTLNFEGI